MPANQAFYGLGEYGGPLNRRYTLAGKEFECWAEGTYNWYEFNNPEYMNIPFFYGISRPMAPSRRSCTASSLTILAGHVLIWGHDCELLSTETTFQAGDGQMDYFFFSGGTNHTMAAVVNRYSQLTGRPTMLPKWAIGHHLSRFSYWCQSWVQYLADTAIASNIPLDAVYLDIDYMTTDDTPGQWSRCNNSG